MWIWFTFGFMCALVILLAAAYFKFVSLQKAVRRAKLRLEAQLKNRRELIPTLALSAAGVAGLERTEVYELSALKDKCSLGDCWQKRIACEAEISRCLRKIFITAQAQPELQKDEHFLHLRQNLSVLEEKIQSSKKRYNSAVRDFNTLATVVPLNLVARCLEFNQFEYFDFDGSL